MIKSNKKVISGALVGLAIFGGAFQCKGILVQAEGVSSQQEERFNSKQRRDLVSKREIEHYMRLSGKYEILKSFGFVSVISKDADNLKDFIKIESSLESGKNYMILVGSSEIFIKVK